MRSAGASAASTTDLASPSRLGRKGGTRLRQARHGRARHGAHRAQLGGLGGKAGRARAQRQPVERRRRVEHMVGQAVQVVLPAVLVKRAVAAVGRHQPHQRASRCRQAQRVDRHKVQLAAEALAALLQLPAQAGGHRDRLLDQQLLRERRVRHQAAHHAAHHLRVGACRVTPSRALVLDKTAPGEVG